MRVIKPMSLSLLTRNFEYREGMYCGVAILAFVPLDSRRALFSEPAMWTTAAEVIGRDSALDVGMPKQGGEFLVSGCAWPDPGSDKTKCRVSVRFGKMEKVLNVFGDRYFLKDGISEPSPFDSMPLTWERAFGGKKFKRNPNGRGLDAVVDESGHKRVLLPNVEYPGGMVHLPGQKAEPAGFEPVDLTWPQRLKRAGTYDDAWLKNHYPGLPTDIDWRFFNIGSDDQQQTEPFAGDEEYVIERMHPERARIEGVLPGFCARCFIRRTDGQELEELGTRLTTVWFLPEQERAILIFHATAEVTEEDASDIAEIMIAADDAASPRPASHYAEVFLRRMDEDRGLLETLNDKPLLPPDLEKSDAIDPDALIRKATASFLANNLREQGDKRRVQVEQELRSNQAKWSEVLGDQEEPSLDEAFAERELPSLEELPEFVEKVLEEAEQSRRTSAATAAMRRRELDLGVKEMGGEPVDLDPSVNQHAWGPPRFSAAARQEEIRSTLNEQKSSGIPIDEQARWLLGPEAFEQMCQAEAAYHTIYRSSAHYQHAAPAASPGKEMASRLKTLLAEGASVDALDFTGADLGGMNLAGANLAGIFLESANLGDADLRGAVLDRAVLAHANLGGANLEQASLVGTNLGKASLKNLRARGANLRGAILNECDLTDACLREAILVDADFTSALFSSTAMAGCDASGLTLIKTSLAGLDLSNCNLEDAVFVELDVSRVDFSESRLDKAVFVDCMGQGARFVGASLHNLRVVLACDFSNCDFSGANLSEANFRGTRLNGSRFDDACLDKADFSEVVAPGASLCRIIARGCQWVKADLRECDFGGANLMQGSMERADLRDASLKDSNLFQLDMARVHVNRQTDFSEALTKKMRTYPRKFMAERKADS